jgi:predicted CoA-binding protein
MKAQELFSKNVSLNGAMPDRSSLFLMPLTTDEEIADLLTSTRTVALVGASLRPNRPSHRVMQYLLNQGYSVYPVNLCEAGKTILGSEVYATLSDVPVPIDLVDVFRRSQFVMGIVNEAILIKAKAVWTQLEVIDEKAAARAEGAGLKIVMDRCPAIELPNFKAAGLVDRDWRADQDPTT